MYFYIYFHLDKAKTLARLKASVIKCDRSRRLNVEKEYYHAKNSQI